MTLKMLVFNFSLSVLIVFFIFLGTYLTMEADTAPHVNPEPYPMLDADGYYMAYKEGDTWVNWWARDKPSTIGVFAQFMFNKVCSNFRLAITVITLHSTFMDEL
jgi:hypothetical protein